MTLQTQIRVLDVIPAEPLFRFGQELVSLDGGKRPEDQSCSHTLAGERTSEWSEWRAVNNSWRNELGQGLLGILSVSYGNDGPLVDDEEIDVGVPNPAFLEISFDTGYGYKNERGGGCGDLHAYFITRLAEYFEGLGVKRWAWRNEFTGEWFFNIEGPAGDELYELGYPALGNPQ